MDNIPKTAIILAAKSTSGISFTFSLALVRLRSIGHLLFLIPRRSGARSGSAVQLMHPGFVVAPPPIRFHMASPEDDGHRLFVGRNFVFNSQATFQCLVRSILNLQSVPRARAQLITGMIRRLLEASLLRFTPPRRPVRSDKGDFHEKVSEAGQPP